MKLGPLALLGKNCTLLNRPPFRFDWRTAPRNRPGTTTLALTPISGTGVVTLARAANPLTVASVGKWGGIGFVGLGVGYRGVRLLER